MIKLYKLGYTVRILHILTADQDPINPLLYRKTRERDRSLTCLDT